MKQLITDTAVNLTSITVGPANNLLINIFPSINNSLIINENIIIGG